MISLYIDNQKAVLPSDVSIRFKTENPYFTRSSNYSYEIELPMPANKHIFGLINRLTVSKTKLIKSAKLYDNYKLLLSGSAVLLNVENDLLKIQLVSGNAEFNLLTNNDLYIDELDLGRESYPSYPTTDSVRSLVLCNDKLYNRNITGYLTYNFNVRNYDDFCVQPYLHIIIKKIVELFGYNFDTSFFTNSFYQYIYICSAVQTDYFAESLPHWSISKFFEEVEKFLSAIMIVNELTKTVSFVSLSSYYALTEKAYFIDSDCVLDNYTAEVDKDEIENISVDNVSYNLPSITSSGIWRLDRELFDRIYISEFDNWDTLYAYWQSNLSRRNSTLYCTGNRYYVNWFNDNSDDYLKEVNLYADLIRHETDDDGISLDIVPALMTSYNFGNFNNSSDFNNYIYANPLYLYIPQVSFHKDKQRNTKVNLKETIENNTSVDDSKKEIMEVAIYVETTLMKITVLPPHVYAYFLQPFTDYNQRTSNQQTDFPEYSLSLNDVCNNSIGHNMRSITDKIKADNPYTMRFITTEILNPKHIFVINNQKYACESLEYLISAETINKVVEGTFYRLD